MPQITIGGTVFNVEPMDGLRSFDLQPRIAPIVGELVRVVTGALETGMIKAGADGKPGELSLDNLDTGPLLEVALPALTRVCGMLPRGELGTITRELLTGATVIGAQGAALLFGAPVPGGATVDTFGQLMRGRTLDTWRLLFFALRTHYPDLFGLLAARGGAATATANPSATSPT